MTDLFAQRRLLGPVTFATIALAAVCLTPVAMPMSNGLIAQRLLLRFLTFATIGLAAAYLARVVVPRPPIGLFVRSDVWVMITVLVVMPFVYLAIPVVLVVTIFGIVMFIATQLTFAPLIGGRSAALVAGLLCGADVITFAVGWQYGVLVVNDLIIMIVVAGVTNLWTQTGMTPGHVAVFSVVLTVYDTFATGLSGLTADFTDRTVGLPFAPLLATHYHPSVFLGLGDCLLLTIWPLVAAKTYGRTAGWTAALIDLLMMGPVVALMTRILGFSATVPVATPLGLLITAQYLYWRRRAQKTAVAEAATTRPHLTDGLRALDALADLSPPPSTWAAMHQGQIIATGTSPGTACRTARRTGLTAVPTTALMHQADLDVAQTQRPG